MILISEQQAVALVWSFGVLAYFVRIWRGMKRQAKADCCNQSKRQRASSATAAAGPVGPFVVGMMMLVNAMLWPVLVPILMWKHRGYGRCETCGARVPKEAAG